MNDNLINCKVEYEKALENFNKKSLNFHNILSSDYEVLCMNFFEDKYNTFEAQKLAHKACVVAMESEILYVDWLNKEWYV